VPEPSKGKRRRGSQQRRADGRTRAGTTPVEGARVAGRIPGIPWLVGGAIVLVVLIGGFLLLRPGGLGGGTGAAASPSASGAGASSAPAASCPTSQPPALPAGQTRTVTITTDKGTIGIGVVADLSPIAAGNFVALASCGFYDGSPFHRVVPNFVIQGGALASGEGPGYTINDEPVTALYSRGTVAMARTSQPNSVDSQFFIVVDDSARAALARYNTYQIIGTVTSGMATVDAIASAADKENPTNPVIMTSVTVANP
jgi:cyclophilin family peptidyl-prolyl cis-trans isomerase